MWNAVCDVAPEGAASELISLLVYLHAPQTADDAAEMIEEFFDSAGRHLAPRQTRVRMRAEIHAMLDAHVIALRDRGYLPTEASIPMLIRAVVFLHTPDTRQTAFDLLCRTRANIPPPSADQPRMLAMEAAPVLTIGVPRDLARMLDLVRFELSAAQPRLQLDRLLLGALIWAHANAADRGEIDALMACLYEFEAGVATTAVDARVAFRVPASLVLRLELIADAIQWRPLPRGRLAAALLWTHSATRGEDRDCFERMEKTVLSYAAAGGFAGDESVSR